MIAALLLILMGVFIFIGLPIGFGIGLSGVLGILMNPTLSLDLLPERMHTFTDSFVFIAIPLFILAGSIMEKSGITPRLMALAMALVGHIRGGLAMVTVVAEMLFSGISGSTAADVSAMCSMVMPALNRAKYPPPYSIAVISAASAMGILIPPCIQMIVLGGLVNISVAGLFAGGVIPSLVLSGMIMLLIYMNARRLGFPSEPRCTLRRLVVVFADAIVPLGMPVIIFGGIFGGVFTPTEAGAVTVVYAILADILLYRLLRLKDFVEILIDSAAITGTIMFIVVAASVLSFLLSYMKVPEQFSNLLVYLGVGKVGFLFLSTLVFLIASLVIEPIPAMVIFVPVLFPIAAKLGVDPIHFGIVMIASQGIGMFIPPIGIGLILACSIGKVAMGPVSRSIFPFLLTLVVGLAVLILFPSITTFLPKLISR
jgi:tripartite ATP-independent transporter DctM subunit